MFTIIEEIKKQIIAVLFIVVSISCSKNPVENTDIPEESTPDIFSVNDLSITKVDVSNPIAAGKYRMITFDIKWGNSWRSTSTNNWDAAWVFIKFKTGNEDWKHATLSTNATEHVSPPRVTINSPSDGKGVYLYRSEIGNGTFNAEGVSLRWNYGQDNVPDNAEVNVKIFGIEMVYIPEGSFYAGDNGYSMASFTKGSTDKRSWFINSENVIDVTNTTANGYYYTSSKDFWNETWNASEDVTGTSFAIPADFPKGYRAIYCMKYEMSQQQYVDFLNTLTNTQASNRYDRSNYNKFGYTISESNGVYSTANSKRACGFISPEDGLAFADWCGMRPMTELEFEKICRGSNNQPVKGEYVWGTVYIKNAKAVTGTENDREYITTSGSNCYYPEENFAPQFPLNVGIFSGLEKTREKSGATFYGVMEMSGNISESCITVGNKYGRVFTYRNGDGRLSNDGASNESNWPLSDGKGIGYRGGCFAQDQHCLQTSDRTEATVSIDRTHRHIPWGFRGVRSISY